MARNCADLPMSSVSAGTLVLHNCCGAVVAKGTDADVIPRVSADQQRTSRIRDWHTGEWIPRSGRPAESSPFLYGSCRHCCGCESLDAHVGSSFTGDSGSATCGWDLHGGSLSSRYEDGGQLG